MYLIYGLLLIITGFTVSSDFQLLYFAMAVILFKLSDIEEKMNKIKLFYFNDDKGSAILFGEIKTKKIEKPNEEITVTTCLKCNEVIPDDKDICTCGWTWKE